MKSSDSCSNALESIRAMRRQEKKGYSGGCDYLQQISRHYIRHYDNYYRQQSPDMVPVDLECRILMVDWTKSVVQTTKFHTEITEIAMDYVDRFLSRSVGWKFLLNRTKFQLVVMTALYTATKVHEIEALCPETVAKLSDGRFTRKDIESMEIEMLNNLKWRLHPPTATSFVRLLANAIPSDLLPTSSRKLVFDLTDYQIDLTIGNYSLSLEKSSLIAFAALRNSLGAVETIADHCYLFLESLIKSILKSEEIIRLENVQNHLYEAASADSKSELTSTSSMLLGRQKHPKIHETTSGDYFVRSPISVSAMNGLCQRLSSFDDFLE